MIVASAEVSQLVAAARARAENNRVVETLRGALDNGKINDELVPGILAEMLRYDAWRSRQDENGNLYEFGPDDFADFIAASSPRGLGTTKDTIRKFLGDSTSELRIKFETLAERKPGGTNNPVGINRKPPPVVNHDSVMIDHDVQHHDKQVIEHPDQGNSIGYAIRRFEREAATDQAVAEVYDQLKAGHLTTHAASIEAGFKPRTIQVAADPEKAANLLVRHFTREQCIELVGRILRAHDIGPDALLEAAR